MSGKDELVLTPDVTPPSPAHRIQPWARQIQRELHQLRKDHEALRSKQAADTMAHIHLLTGIATSVTEVSVDVALIHKQIWGAIKELRQQLKGKK